MTKTAQITGFGQNGQRINRPDPGYRAQQLIIWMVGQQLCRAVLNGIALLNKAASLRQNEAEHPYCIGVWRDGQAHGSL